MPLYSARSAIRILAQSAVAVPLTGSTTETAIATVTIPPNAMGPNGIVRVTSLWSMTNSANNKTLRVRFGGTAGQMFYEATYTTVASVRDQRQIANRGATNAQIGASRLTAGGGWGTVTVAPQAASVDTTAPVDLVLSGTLALGTETITLEAYLVELIPG